MYHKLSRPVIYVLVSISAAITLASCSQTPASTSGTATQVSTGEATVQTQQSRQNISTQAVPEINLTDLATLMINVEDKFGLKDVLISQTGSLISVRMMAPTITGTELDSGLALVLAYLSDNLPSDIQTIDLVFDINNVDSAVLRVARNDIQSWQKGQLGNADFIKKFKRTSLL